AAIFFLRRNVVAAPIQRYQDPRLNGFDQTLDFTDHYYRFRSVFSPLLPSCDPFEESKQRIEKAAFHAMQMVKAAPTALQGRLTQLVHYHSLSEEQRRAPAEEVVNGLKLPKLKKPSIFPSLLFSGTKEDCAKQILSSGFDVNKTRKSAL